MRAFVILLLFLPGCVGPGAEACSVPAPTVGSVATYAATGPLFIPNQGVVVDWGLAGGPQGAKGVNMTAGSKVTWNFEPARLALSSDGLSRPAFQITYSVEVPGKGKMDFAAHMIDLETGALVQYVGQNQYVEGQRIAQQVRFTLQELPGAFLTQAFWGRAWDGAEAAWPYAGERAAGGPAWNGTIQAQIGVEDDCGLTIKGAWADAVPWTFELSYSGLPVPEELRFSRGKALLEMHLIDFKAGNGTALPPYDRDYQGPAQSALLQPLSDGWPAGDVAIPTSFKTALAAAEADAEVSDWLASHPSARPAAFRHVLGRPSVAPASVIDAWTLVWATPARGLEVEVVARRDFLDPVLGERLEVTSDIAHGSEQVFERALPLYTLASIGEKVQHEPIEFIDCIFSDAICFVGSHAGTGKPYYQESGSYDSGLVFEFSTGLLLQESSLIPKGNCCGPVS